MKILMVSSERSSSDLSEYTLFVIKKYMFTYKNQFLGEKWKTWIFFSTYQIIEKITSKSIILYPDFIQKKIWQ